MAEKSKCPECGKEIEDLRATCPNCGYEYKESDYDNPEEGQEFTAGAMIDDEGEEITDQEVGEQSEGRVSKDERGPAARS